jgi:fatty acid desaturase
VPLISQAVVFLPLSNHSTLGFLRFPETPLFFLGTESTPLSLSNDHTCKNGVTVAGNTQFRLGDMAPAPSALPQVVNNSFIAADGRAVPQLRAELRRIPSWKNAWSVLWMYGQNILILVAAVRINHLATWLIAFLLMGRMHAQFASLMHEAAHRLLFTHRKANDLVGNWLLGFPVITSTPAYRRVHMAHHRQEFGPEEPDIPLYANYPVQRASLRRKLVRDLTGRTGIKLFRQQLRGFRSPDQRVRRTLWKMTLAQVIIASLFALAGHFWMYPVMFVVPYFTVWRVINRLRSIAEHGGLRADKDRRITTHSVSQHWLARFYLVPYNIGFHLAHHVDAGVPFRNLPRYHAMLREYQYVDNSYEYASYRDLWRALATTN